MTKYCSYFLKNISCPNSDCVFLHKIAREKDCFWREKTVGGLFIVPNKEVITYLIDNYDKLLELKEEFKNKNTILPNILEGIKEIEKYADSNNIQLYNDLKIDINKSINKKQIIESNKSISKEKSNSIPINNNKSGEKDDISTDKTDSKQNINNINPNIEELPNLTTLDQIIIKKLVNNKNNFLNKSSRFETLENKPLKPNPNENSLNSGSLNILKIINDFVYNENENHFKINENINLKSNKIGEEVKNRKISMNNENNLKKDEFNLFCQKVKINLADKKIN